MGSTVWVVQSVPKGDESKVLRLFATRSAAVQALHDWGYSSEMFPSDCQPFYFYDRKLSQGMPEPLYLGEWKVHPERDQSNGD